MVNILKRDLEEANRIDKNLIKRAIEMDGTCTGGQMIYLKKKFIH